MPKLGGSECYRLIRPVAIEAALRELGAAEFIAVGRSKAGAYPCDVVLRDRFPPAVAALVDGLGLGGDTARAVLRRLAPRQDIPVHVDDWMPAEADWRRFQVPLVTDPRVIMRWPDDGQEAHLAAGWLYEVRFDRPHAVVNGWDGERIHLQVDQVDATI